MSRESSIADDLTIPLDDVAVLLEFVERSSGAGSLPAMVNVLRRQLQGLAIGHFALRLGSESAAEADRYNGVWSYPREWNRVFAANRYGASSPVLQSARVRRRPFNWFEILSEPGLAPIQRRMFAEAVDYGIGMGMTVPVHAPGGGMTAISFSADPALDPTADMVRVKSWALTLLGLGFVELSRPHLIGRSIALDEIDLRCFPDNDNEPPFAMVAPRPKRHVLTPFESECLSWSSAGLSSWEISERFSLSQAAVDHAFESARVKLGAATRTHAVVKAIIERLVAP